MGIETSKQWMITKLSNYVVPSFAPERHLPLFFSEDLSSPELMEDPLKGTGRQDWMMWRNGRRAASASECTMPSVAEFFVKLVNVWPLIVSYLKRTEYECDVDGSTALHFFVISPFLFCLWLLNVYPIFLIKRKGIDGYFSVDQIAWKNFQPLGVIFQTY